MWLWQSQELAGAFNFGASVPLDHLTCCAAALRVPPLKKPAAAPADMTFNNSRRSGHDFLQIVHPEPYYFRRSIVAFGCMPRFERRVLLIVIYAMHKYCQFDIKTFGR
jgi:hypothetical protein